MVKVAFFEVTISKELGRCSHETSLGVHIEQLLEKYPDGALFAEISEERYTRYREILAEADSNSFGDYISYSDQPYLTKLIMVRMYDPNEHKTLLKTLSDKLDKIADKIEEREERAKRRLAARQNKTT